MGFVGSHWCERLLKEGKKVYAIDLGLHHKPLLDHENFVFVQDTIKNYEVLNTLVDRVDCVCHFAGIAEPDQYVKYPRKVIDITAVAGIKLIEMCRLKDKLFFLTSTSEIYGKSPEVPFREDGDRTLGSTMTKRWCYSTSKALLEHYLDACAFSKELNYVVVRLFNIYGPRLKGRVVSNFVKNAVAGEDLIVHGDGNQTRCFTYIDDTIEAFYRLITNDECYNQVYNVGNPVETTVGELAELTCRLSETESKVQFMKHDEYYGKSYEDIGRRVPNIDKIKSFTNWEPSTSLETGLREMITYERNYVE